MTSSNEKARGSAGIPKKPEIRGDESTAIIQIRVQRYFNALRACWQCHGIDVNTTDTSAQISRLAAILRVQGSYGLGSVEGRTAGGMLQLPARIFDLRARGWEILAVRESTWGADGLRHPRTVRYFVISEPSAEHA
ncbi:helix-turn-helix domain-containing protein [Ralstonia flatus]|uniref:helix-turn-helix domain-containing protein n=1 Tax=Ralstonia flatus TaxID=3058601 RepID=UPI00292D56FF|nr:helix-turn-helix domain-containing protein [Ralstonia sp. LMG 32965]